MAALKDPKENKNQEDEAVSWMDELDICVRTFIQSLDMELPATPTYRTVLSWYRPSQDMAVCPKGL
ncbi:hypothetical protein RvY_11064 [Ramazzottius varieornatus]|uniref:Uncharacterized protein n=1 Tax=Ramazzottius varieornatus TaxID=947166 RepID=A0A1D1VEV8_RAMVA|nr:hypothetical protein RvY_11064 [Ramazzottius varieornatus]